MLKRTSSILQFHRRLSTSAVINVAYAGVAPTEGLNHYMAIIPDISGSNRMGVRPAHLLEAVAGKKNGWIVQAGAIFSHDHNSPESTMTGSWLIVRETTIEAAQAMLEQDLYALNGVWDLQKASITPIAVATLK